MSRARRIISILLSCLFVIAGVFHFTHPEVFVEIIPAILPAKKLIVYVSGMFEIAGGITLQVPITRRSAGIGLIALLIAVFPANINMLMRAEHYPAIPTLALWLRLPLQFVLIYLVYWSSIRENKAET
ncbi:MAG: MauE/DoxX family redox-associated membrane protein [Candidatus Obscuribacterales bacterium]